MHWCFSFYFTLHLIQYTANMSLLNVLVNVHISNIELIVLIYVYRNSINYNYLML